MFKVECPGCKAPYQVDERRVPPSGLKMRCPKCGSSFQVERPGGGEEEGSGSVLGASLGFSTEGAVRKKPPLPKQKPKLKGTMLGVAPPRPAGGTAAKPRIPRPAVEAREAAPDPFAEADLPAVRSERAAPAPEAEPLDLDLDLPVPARSDESPALDLDVGLPAPVDSDRRAPPIGEADLPMALRVDADSSVERKPAAPLGADLPARPAHRAAGAVHADLPERVSSEAGAAEPDLPAALGSEMDLPSPREGIDLPSPASEVDLPSVGGADLPSPSTGVDLPSTSAGLPSARDLGGFGEIDLPLVGADLPSPGAELPSEAAELPDQAAGLPEQPAGLPEGGLGHGAAHSGPELDPFSGPDPFGSPEGPDPFGAPSSSPPERSSDPFGNPFGGQPAASGATDPFGSPPDLAGGPAISGAPPADDSVEADIPIGAEPGQPVVRQAAGGTEFGEVNLEESEAGASVGLDGELPSATADDDMEFGALPTEGDAGPSVGAAQVRIAVPQGGAVAEIKAKRRRRRLRVAVAALFVAAVTGGALTLVPSVGPFGAHFIVDQLRSGEYERVLAETTEAVHQKLSADTFTQAREAYREVEAARADAPRFEPLAAYSAYVGMMSVLRFGAQPELHAQAKVLLDELSDAEDVDRLRLARATKEAADGQLARARQMLGALASASPKSIDVAVVQAEVELRARDHEAALASWTRAGKLETSARTAFGLARAQLAAGDIEAARASAARALDLNPEHVGSRILLAKIAWSTSQDEARATTLLQAVIDAAKRASPDELVQAQTLLGTIHLDRGRISHAEKAFSEALKIDPKAAQALSGFGGALYKAGRYSQALARFKAAAQADPDHIGAKVGVAKASLQLERLEEARQMLDKLKKSHPKDLQVNYWFGRVQEASGARDLAEKAYRDAIEAGGNDPATVHAYVSLANVQSQQGDLEEASKTLRTAEEKLPDSPEIHKALGRVAMSQGRYDDAQSEFDAALALDPDDVDARFLVGTALTRLRKFERALQIFEEVAKVDRDFPGLALERGRLYQESGRAEEALKEYEAALAKAPEDPDLMLRVGCGKASAGNGPEAEKLLRNVLAQRPNSAETHYCLGRALLTKKNLADALRELERAVQLDPNRAEYHLYVGWAANEAGDLALAAKSLKKALELDQGLADAYWQRGILHVRQTRPRDAVADLTKALELRPSRYEAHAALADAYYDLGREQEALSEWQKAISANPEEATWRFRYGKLLNLNLRNAEAVTQLEKAIELAGTQQEAPPVWLHEAHRLAALSLGNKPAAIEHWQSFLRLAPLDSPFRDEAKEALARLGKPWRED